MAGISPSETPGSSLLKGKGLPRSLTVGEVSERMKQRSRDRMALLIRPSSAQQLDCHKRREEMTGTDRNDIVEDREMAAELRISTSCVRSSLNISEHKLLSPTSSWENSDIRLDFGASDRSSASDRVRSDLSAADEDSEGETKEREWEIGLTKSDHVRAGKENRGSTNGFMERKKWRSFIGSLRGRLQREQQVLGIPQEAF